MNGQRFLRFNGVSSLGIGVQLATIWGLTQAHATVAVATGVGVAAAVLHNFVWHWSWTWADRREHGSSPAAALARFALVNGTISMAGNLVVTTALGAAGVPVILANLAAIVGCGVVNYWTSDVLVFRGQTPSRGAMSLDASTDLAVIFVSRTSDPTRRH